MNKFEKRSRDSYNQKAKHYDESFEGRFTIPFKEMLLGSVSVPDGGTVLDVACGNGRFLQMLSKQNKFIGFGTDISDKMIECAKQLHPCMKFEVASCENLPHRDETMDVITVCAAFHHFPDVSKFAQEAYRVMKKGGTIYIADIYYPTIIRVIANPFVPLSKVGDVKFYSPKEIQKVLDRAGFKSRFCSKEGNVQVVCGMKL